MYLTLSVYCCFILQSEVLDGVDAVKGAAKKALAAHEHSVEHSEATASALTGLKQVRRQCSVRMLGVECCLG